MEHFISSLLQISLLHALISNSNRFPTKCACSHCSTFHLRAAASDFNSWIIAQIKCQKSANFARANQTCTYDAPASKKQLTVQKSQSVWIKTTILLQLSESTRLLSSRQKKKNMWLILTNGQKEGMSRAGLAKAEGVGPRAQTGKVTELVLKLSLTSPNTGWHEAPTAAGWEGTFRENVIVFVLRISIFVLNWSWSKKFPGCG